MVKSTISMAIFNSYVKLPEGIPIWLTEIEDGTWTSVDSTHCVDCPQRPANEENQKSHARQVVATAL